jgi:hypothetical protein
MAGGNAEAYRKISLQHYTGDQMAMAMCSWIRSGMVCYTVAHDLMVALCMTDVPEGVMDAPLPHQSFWVGVDGVALGLTVLGEPIDGFMCVSDNHECMLVGMTRLLMDKSNNYYAVKVDNENDKSDIAVRMRGIFHRVVFYLMDPAHEEAGEPLHSNREWRGRIKAIAPHVKDPGGSLPLVRNRVLGGSYRIPDDANVGDGTVRHLRHPVRGHIRLQRVGEGRREVRATWVRPHWRGPENGATAAIIRTVHTPAAPSLTHEQRVARVREAMENLVRRDVTRAGG